MAAQQLRPHDPAGGEEPRLSYWQREGGRPGEIDFLAEVEGSIIPIELKAGFMHDKALPLAVRCDANPPLRMTGGRKKFTVPGKAARPAPGGLP